MDVCGFWLTGKKMALTVKKVLRLKQRGKYPDGLGLYLQVNGNNRSWIFRYKQHGVQHWMGLGSAATYNLDEARELARKARQQIKEGIDPLLARQAQLAELKLAATKKRPSRSAPSATWPRTPATGPQRRTMISSQASTSMYIQYAAACRSLPLTKIWSCNALRQSG